MAPRLTCPFARYGEQTVIQCNKTGEACAHQRYCTGMGWYVLTDQAGNCPARKENEDNGTRKKTTASKKRRNKI